MKHRLAAAAALCTAGVLFAQDFRPRGGTPFDAGPTDSPGLIGDLPNDGRIVGRIELIDRAQLAAAQNGIIDYDVPRRGDRVRKGEMIAKLDDSVPQASLRVAEAQAASDVDARVARAISKVAGKELASAEAANNIYDRTVSAVELERLKLTKTRSDLDVEKAQTDYQIAKAREDEARSVLTTYEIKAPFDGVIRERFKQRGEAVRQGDPIVELVNDERVAVVANVPVDRLPGLQVGQMVGVKPAYGSDNRPAQGTIRLIDTFGDGQAVGKRVRVVIEVPNDGRFFADLEAEVML